MAISPVGIHHVGVTVKSLDRSLAFYHEVLGLEPEMVFESEGPDASRALDVEDAKLTIAFLPLGSAVLELIEYHTDRDEVYNRRNCDVGAAHVCFEVDDIHEAYQKIVEMGVDVVADPLLIETGPLAGCQFLYFRDPDGITLELFELP